MGTASELGLLVVATSVMTAFMMLVACCRLLASELLTELLQHQEMSVIMIIPYSDSTIFSRLYHLNMSCTYINLPWDNYK